ncbi:MAG TPA: SPOR domain-containing protein [Candidatus Binatus sp.]|nr:SPOR domain-containing protein [Candidatus Binatus sp.]
MRFEIRAGGTILILAGLVGLSGAVFALGLVAGYEMARQNQPNVDQISTTYPLPNPPEKPGPVAEISPASPAVASPAIAPAPRAVEAPIKPPAPAMGEMTSAARSSPATVARVRPPAIAPVANPPSEDEDSDEDTDTASASAPAIAPPPRPLPPGVHPYNIQIEAVMDKTGADEMVARLKSLGYNAQETRIQLSGETWYRVQVGPYASADEATAAQNRLREQYKQAYTTSH